MTAPFSSYPDNASAALPKVPVDAIVNLVNYQQQCDEDGVMVQVSRQALAEVLVYLTEVRPDNKWADGGGAPAQSTPVNESELLKHWQRVADKLQNELRTSGGFDTRASDLAQRRFANVRQKTEMALAQPLVATKAPDSPTQKQVQAAIDVFNDNGIDFRAPWECSLDDSERGRFEALQCAIQAAFDAAPRCVHPAQTVQEPVAYRWRAPGNKHWIYDPTPEWIEDHKHEIELEALYTSSVASTKCGCLACDTDGPHDSDCAVHGAPHNGWGSCNCSLSSTVSNTPEGK